jgi:hypothetical protein
MLLAATLALACGSDEESVEPKLETFTIETEEGAFQVEADEEGIRISGEEEGGGAVAGQFGEAVEIPDQFPTDVPLYPDAKVVAAMMTEGQGMLTLRTGDDPDQVADFLRKQFEEEGWSFGSELDLMGQQMLAFEKGDRIGAVQISREESETTIVLTVGSGE